ncbi:MAG: IS630 family transposase [Dethiobacter sp.]|nr:MAG: IS630 family transposase [Dethiobacter sp.]
MLQLANSVQAAAGIANCAASTARKWYNRYLKDGISGLKDLPRSGRPRVFKEKFKLQVIAIACQKPAETYLPGVTYWSLRDLAMMLPRLLDVESISTESVRRILREHHLKPHRIEYYLTRTDPDFFRKAERILNIYQSPPKDGLVLSVDERTAIQVLERLYPGLPLKPGHPEKVEFHYKRHTPFSLIAGLCIQNGQVFGRCYQRHTQYQFLDFMQSMAELYPDTRLYIILDNLKTHKTKLVKNWLAEQKGRIEFIFTPFHGSWLNQIEIWFGILEKKCLKRMDVSSTVAGQNHTLNFIDTWNSYYTKPFNWKFTVSDLKEMLSQEPITLPI